ncbi:hypothetical protein A2U01_0110306, partial [Trifolium medium]|nr:hypothetical protein [Trifolium medium]
MATTKLIPAAKGEVLDGG